MGNELYPYIIIRLNENHFPLNCDTEISSQNSRDNSFAHFQDGKKLLFFEYFILLILTMFIFHIEYILPHYAYFIFWTFPSNMNPIIRSNNFSIFLRLLFQEIYIPRHLIFSSHSVFTMPQIVIVSDRTYTSLYCHIFFRFFLIQLSRIEIRTE